jgi:uncharacterized protein (TIGR03435 family)
MGTTRVLLAVAVVAPLAAQDLPGPSLPPYTATPIRRTLDPTTRTTRFTPGALLMNGGTIRQIFQLAYPSEGMDPIGIPDWMQTDRYDLTVKFDGSLSAEQQQAVFRHIFADQLKLQAHFETRETPVYYLELARGDGRLGSTMRRLAIDCDALRDAARRGEAVSPPPPAGNSAPGCGDKFGNGTILSGGMTMARLAGAIRNVAGRLILDRTGLDGFYEFALEWAPARPPSADAAPDDRPNIFTAVREQLGLRLEAGVAPVQVVVIDHVERPAER